MTVEGAETSASSDAPLPPRRAKMAKKKLARRAEQERVASHGSEMERKRAAERAAAAAAKAAASEAAAATAAAARPFRHERGVFDALALDSLQSEVAFVRESIAG